MAAAISGLVIAVALLHGVWWLSFVCMVPWFLSMRGTGTRAGLLLGLACGVAAWSVATWWSAVGLWAWNSMEPWRAALSVWLLFVYQALPYAVFGAWYGWRARASRFGASMDCGRGLAGGTAFGSDSDARPPGVLEASALLTVLICWYPTVVPGTPAHPLGAQPVLVQVLELGGNPLLFFLCALVNIFFAHAVAAFFSRRKRVARRAAGPARDLVFGVLIMAGLWAYGAVRMPMVEQAEAERVRQGEKPVSVTMVQPHLPIRGNGMVYFATEDGRLNSFGDLRDQVRQAATEHPSLILLPELPTWVECWDQDDAIRSFMGAAQGKSTQRESVQDLGAQKAGIPLLLSCGQTRVAASEEKESGTRRGYYNCAAVVESGRELDPSKGLGAVYHKRMLVPFGEYVPFEETVPFLRKVVTGAKHYVSGKTHTVFAVGGLKLAPLLCYEVHFAGLARAQRLAGANVLANLADIAWFGPTGVTILHETLARFRAVELRMPLLIVNNSGPTMAVDTLGRTVPGSSLALHEAGVARATILPAGPASFYALHGDVFLQGLTVALALAWIWRAIRGRRCRPTA